MHYHNQRTWEKKRWEGFDGCRQHIGAHAFWRISGASLLSLQKKTKRLRASLTGWDITATAASCPKEARSMMKGGRRSLLREESEAFILSFSLLDYYHHYQHRHYLILHSAVCSYWFLFFIFFELMLGEQACEQI